MRFNETGRLLLFSTDCIKNFDVGMHSDVYKSVCFELHFVTSLIDLDLIHGHGSERKQKCLQKLYHKVFKLFK